MPTRLIREGIINSDRINELDWAAEVFYRRLLNKVDDHGLFDARPSVLRTSLYPLKVDRVREADCSRWLAACEKAGLIILYEAEKKPFLKVLDTRWQTRSEPKYPQPPATVNNCKQVRTPVTVVEDVVVVEVEGKTLSGKPDAIEVLKFLNLKANRNYKPVKANVEIIQARLAESFTVAELKQVVAKKCREWLTDDKMAEYLRPKTLFSRTNFANYAGELVDAAEPS
mgnify:CR=1 FL=1